MQALDHRHIKAMFDALDVRNAQIIAAKASDDPRDPGVGARSPADGRRQPATATRDSPQGPQRHHPPLPLRDSNPAIGVELRPEKKPKPKVWTPPP